MHFLKPGKLPFLEIGVCLHGDDSVRTDCIQKRTDAGPVKRPRDKIYLVAGLYDSVSKALLPVASTLKHSFDEFKSQRASGLRDAKTKNQHGFLEVATAIGLTEKIPLDFDLRLSVWFRHRLTKFIQFRLQPLQSVVDSG
jgi:hypothetical protein